MSTSTPPPAAAADDEHAARLRRVRFRAWRRGFREADLILGPFADARLQHLTPQELDSFEALLEENDHDLYGWIIGREAPPRAHDGPVLAMIRLFRNSAAAVRGA